MSARTDFRDTVQPKRYEIADAYRPFRKCIHSRTGISQPSPTKLAQLTTLPT